jgi:CRP/FNR family transcriptional regulator, cyclic AMP receptor protein
MRGRCGDLRPIIDHFRPTPAGDPRGWVVFGPTGLDTRPFSTEIDAERSTIEWSCRLACRSRLDSSTVEHDPPDWRCRARSRPQAIAIHGYLLDGDDDLAQQFDIRTRFAVRQGTTVRVLEAGVGECDLDATLDQTRNGFGLLVLDGLIAHETRVAERSAVELLGSGDLMQAPSERADAILRQSDRWLVLWPVRLGLLDADFAQRARPWPQISHTLLRRASRRTAEVDAIRAISGHPRLEVRLDLVFWHLAERWGRVEPAGIRLTLPLTHRLLGQLVAAERPSISHALGRLSQAGLVTGTAGDWHLVGSPEEHLESLIERTVRLPPRRHVSPAPPQAV